MLLIIGACTKSEFQQLKEREEAFLAMDVRAFNTACASGITVTFDWSGVPEADLVTYGAENHCDRALRGIARVCVDAAGREAVKKQIEAIVCGFSSQRSVSLKDRMLRYEIDFKPHNDGIIVFEYLQNNL
jgi:hypothetical protein